MTAPYISDIQVKKVIVQNATESLRRHMGTSESVGSDPILVIHTDNEEDLARVLQALRDYGVALAGGTHGWPPAETFAELRDKGLVTGEFIEVVFAGRGVSTTRTR